MTAAPTDAPGAALAHEARRSARIVGVDVARCLALLGMMSAHILPGLDPSTGSYVTWHQQLAGGRSAGLFALLAGVSLALATGRRTPFRGRQLTAARVGVVLRAIVVAQIGLVLGGLDSGVAVILTYYGVLFVLSLPFLGLGWKPLAYLAGAWAILGPVVSHLVRPILPEPSYQVASLEQLVTDPLQMIVELTFTGYYPTFPWLAYVLAGLAIGRLALDKAQVAIKMTLVGGALALGSWAVSWSLVHTDTAWATLQRTAPSDAPGFRDGLDIALVHGLYGQTPTSSWRWLTIVAPHSTTPFDLLHTIGSAMVVLGLALLAGQLMPRLLGVVFAAGAMTLTLYSLHVIALATQIGPDWGTAALYWWHAIGALVIGALWRTFVGQGPLERLTTSFAKLGSTAVLALRPPSMERTGPT